jgi:hypothetical protein
VNQKLENPWEIENNKKTQKPHSKLQQGAIGVTLAGLCWEVLESVTKEQAEILVMVSSWSSQVGYTWQWLGEVVKEFRKEREVCMFPEC